MSASQKSFILHGPQGTGKNLIARELAAHLQLACIVDEWDGRASTFQPMGTLHITTDLPAWAEHNRRALPVEQARQMLGLPQLRTPA